MLSRAIALVAAAMLGASGASWAQSPGDVQVTQTAAGYVAGAPLVIECAISYPVGGQVQSLLWTPALPAGWTLVKTAGAATGNGQPEVDSDGLSVVFGEDDLSQYNPVVFRYTVTVPPGEFGERRIGGTVEYQLDGMANPVPSSSSPLALTDADAAHSAIGYLAGTPMTVTCTFSRPAGVVLQSLLWRPEFPSTNWTLAAGTGAVTGDGGPEVDAEGAAIVLQGDLTKDVLSFTYTVNVPANVTGQQNIGGGIEYQLLGMANPVTTRAKPDPLVVRPMHTLQVASPYGTGQPAVGIYTNYYGTALTNRMSASALVAPYTNACAGWLLSGNEPVTGTGAECQLSLTNNAALTWVWVAPAIGPRMVNELAPLTFQSAVAYTDARFQPLSLTYSLDTASLAAGMTITSGGAFSWMPTEEQGGQTYSVTVTVTDSGAEPHWLTASETFTITVAEVNRAPTLGALSDQLADAASTLTFTATATDPDVPAQTLTFSLDVASQELGMAIDPASGVFTWSPTVEQAGVAGQSYTVQVTVTDNGSNLANLSDTKSFTIAVADSRGTHATAGYLQGRTAKIECTFEHPANKALLSLLWRPILPAGWELLSVAGQAEPEIDRTDGTIVFAGGGLTAPNPLTFSYMVSVPAGVTGPQTLRAQAEYQTEGMVNPVIVPVNPDPLLVPELHTFEVISAEGHCVPAVGVYTNLHGAALSASVSTPFTSETRTFACTGWTMTGIEPATGPGDSVSMTLTQDAVLTWNWVSPLIAPATSVSVTMDEDNAPTAWAQPALSASEPYRPELVSGLAWSLLTPPAHGAATVTGTGAAPAISYAPSANWYGSDSFLVQVADGLGGFDHVTVNVTVNPVNDAPVLGAIGNRRTDEFTPLAFTVSATDLDVPAQSLTYTMSGAPAGALLDPSTGAFTWTPAEGQAGAGFAEFGVTVTVTDSGTYPDGQTDSETFTITLDSSRATHSTRGYVAGQAMTVDCSFQYPATGRQLQSLLWVPELPAGWTVVSASGQGDPVWEPSDGAFVFQGADLPTRNPVPFSFVVLVPPGMTGTNRIGGTAEYQLDGMPNPATVRVQPDLLAVPMLLTLPQLVVADKVYDGLTNATVVTYGSLSGLMAGHEDVTLVTTDASAYFDTPTVGVGKVVTVGGLTLSGADAGWYSITTQMVAAAITPAPLTVTADPQTKTYGDENPPLTFRYSGFVNGETAAVLDTVPTASTTVTSLTGTGTHLGAITVSGGADINYAFIYVPADFEVTRRPATVVADAQTKVYGAADPVLTYAVAPALVAGDAFTGALARDAGEDVGTYAIKQGTLALSGNYDLTYAGANLTITKLAVAVTADAQTKVYGAADPVLTYAVAPALVAGDAFEGALARDAGEDVGTYAIKQGTLALSGNYDLTYTPANLEIAPKALTVGGTFTVANKPYDGTTAATISVNGLTLLTPVGGDDVKLNAVAVFDSVAVGSGKTVSLSAATMLSGADAGNYTLSLVGAPTTTADILFPAVSASHECDGYRSPSSGIAVSCSFTFPAGETLTSLVWRPILPSGWTLLAASGDGAPTLAGDGSSIVFAGPFTQAPVMFSYTMAVPGNQAVKNYLAADVEFGLASMSGGSLIAENLPGRLLLKRYHSADYQAPFWVIDVYEANKLMSLSRAPGYTFSAQALDNFVGTATPDNENVVDGRHSADTDVPLWKIDTTEANRVLYYYRSGGYHVSETVQTPDGYAPGL